MPSDPSAQRGRRRAAVKALALALAASATTLGVAAEAAPEAGRLAGKLLVATREMSDPRFSRTVVYLVHHDEGGAMGLVVNRPFEEVPISLLLRRLGHSAGAVEGSLRMHYGGPVEPGRVLVLHTADYQGEGTHVIADGIALTARPDILRAIGAGAGPRRALLFLSYSGWGPGQLEREIRAGAWTTVPADPAIVFDGEYDTKWERATAGRRGGKIDL
jgi:putative transcriptional regulator